MRGPVTVEITITLSLWQIQLQDSRFNRIQGVRVATTLIDRESASGWRIH
jgi:hypothetical protein